MVTFSSNFLVVNFNNELVIFQVNWTMIQSFIFPTVLTLVEINMRCHCEKLKNVWKYVKQLCLNFLNNINNFFLTNLI
jgi:hypothetical protein